MHYSDIIGFTCNEYWEWSIIVLNYGVAGGACAYDVINVAYESYSCDVGVYTQYLNTCLMNICTISALCLRSHVSDIVV